MYSSVKWDNSKVTRVSMRISRDGGRAAGTIHGIGNEEDEDRRGRRVVAVQTV